MTTTYQIIPARGIVYVRHADYVSVAECLDAFAAYGKDPKAAPGQTQIIDYSGATAYEKDWTRFMALQAQIADAVPLGTPQTLVIQLAPGKGVPHQMAMMVCKSWDQSPHVVPRIAQTESEALALAGLAETSFADLLALADTRTA